MRPDQHKKKKNSEYKKKHGIPSGKGEKHDKKGSTGRHRSDEKPVSDQSKSGQTGLETTDVEGESSSHGRGNFSRRKIESNWNRYEDDDFEDESEANNVTSALSSVPIGADFQTLLDKATSGSSHHFQFKNEKEWENLNTDEGKNKISPSLLSIDCNALAQSLRNIPLEQRLDIDKKYSIEDKYCGSTANKSQLDRLAINRQVNDQETTKSNSRQNVPPNNMKFSLSQSNKLTEASKKNEKDKYPMIHKLKSPEQKSEHHFTDPESNTEKVQHNAQSTKSDVEDDLELLLGIDNEELNSTHRGNQTGIQGIQASGGTNKGDSTTLQKAQSASDTKENLEDWLDSILD